MNSQQTLPLLAGQRPDGQLIYEELPVSATDEAECYQVLRSPAFCRGVAKGDIIRRLPGGRFEVKQHSGNLAVRVIAKQQLEALAQQLTEKLAGMGGSLDQQSPRMLVLSVPVSAGFDVIEKLMDEVLASQSESAWFYGNVYADDGETPLNWWQSDDNDTPTPT